MPNYCRIWVLLKQRESILRHPREKYHWQLVVENEGSGVWTECHATETEACICDGSRVLIGEEFDSYAATYPVARSEVDNGCCAAVALYQHEKRSEIIEMLQNIDLSEIQSTEATCRTYTQHVLQIIKSNAKQYGIEWQKDFAEIANELQELAGPLEEPLPAVLAPAPEIVETRRTFRSLKQKPSFNNSNRDKAETDEALAAEATDEVNALQKTASVSLNQDKSSSPNSKLRRGHTRVSSKSSMIFSTPWSKSEEWGSKKEKEKEKELPPEVPQDRDSDSGKEKDDPGYRRASEGVPKHRRRFAETIMSLRRRETTLPITVIHDTQVLRPSALVSVNMI